MLFEFDFIEKLCDAEKLIDISSSCVAEQSSISKWSREDDASRVLRNEEGDFANHTDYELEPWLKINLKQPCRPDYVIVQNRARAPFDELAAELIVEWSKDDTDYHCLHKGQLYFGALPTGMPLILPLKRKIKARYIKLRLISKVKVPLHLKRVNILVKKEPDLTLGQNDMVFYASRTDGMGERLKALIHAMVLAEHYDCDFKFTWNNPPYLDDTHAVSDADETFATAFLGKHLVESVPKDLYKLERKVDFYDPDLIKKNAIQVNQNSPFKIIPELSNSIPLSAYRDAFKKMAFSEEVSKAILLAHNVELSSSSVSIHLRSGDIIYGRYRYDDRYTNKVISFAQADYMMSELSASETSIVVFGQTPSVCRYLANKYNAIYMGDDPQVQKLSALQLAVFDMVLMSRTQKIFAGNSGFSQFAELIGEAVICSPLEEFNGNSMASHIESLLFSNGEEQFDSYQLAFNSWHCFYNYNNVIGATRSIDLLQKAVEKDSGNLFYKLALSTVYFSEGKITEAERLIEDVLRWREDNNTAYGSYRFLKNHKHPDGKRPTHNYQKQLNEMSEAGVKGADILAKDIA